MFHPHYGADKFGAYFESNNFFISFGMYSSGVGAWSVDEREYPLHRITLKRAKVSRHLQYISISGTGPYPISFQGQRQRVVASLSWPVVAQRHVLTNA